MRFETEARKGRFFILENFKFRQLNISAFAFLLFAFAFFLTNCKNEVLTNQTVTPTREVTDDLGRSVKLPQTISRAVSLAPNLTENIFAVGAGERLVGVTTFCNYPPEAEKIQKVSDTQTPNMESIIALKPDVVFVSTASQLENFTKILADQNIAVFVTSPNNLEDVFKNLKTFGELFGTTRKSGKINCRIKTESFQSRRKSKGKNARQSFRAD